MNTELDKFYGLIDDIKVAMMTTRRPDGHLESRAMANQKRADGADLWFVTAEGSGKLRDIAHDPHVNLAYCKPGSYEWVSASGFARCRETERRSKNCTSPTGRPDSVRKAIHITVPSTIPVSSSSVSTYMRQSSWKSTNRSLSFSSSWLEVG
jgi:Pyridoxamine 5'-phosphate oxidase like